MKTYEDHCAAYWLQLLGKNCFRTAGLLSGIFGSVREAFTAPEERAVREIGGLLKESGGEIYERISDTTLKDKAKETVDRAYKLGQGIVMSDEEDYPALLGEYSHKPMLLFYYGDIKRVNNTAGSIGVVGSRNVTLYGRDATVKAVEILSGCGVMVVSGMARGIDAIAHRAALDNGIFTAAVLGCGCNVVYPAENIGVFKRLKEQGLILSEYPPDTRPYKAHFPARNRIIAGLSELVLVTEAGTSSGALITADFALDGGRDVMSVPHRIDVPGGAGCNLLIKNGAAVFTSPGDVLQAFHLDVREGASRQISDEALCEEEKIIYRIIKSLGESNEDEIMAGQSSFDARTVKKYLTTLELCGFIKRNSCGGYSCC